VINGAAEILVVDDDFELASTLREFLEQEGCAVVVAQSAEEALQAESQNPELALALLDLMMPMTDGLSLMDSLHARRAELPVVIMTGFGTIETAVEAMKRGAEDYLTKPFDREAVRKKVGRILELHHLRKKVHELEDDLRAVSRPFEKFIHVSSQMHRVVERATAVAASNASVLIVGETGTGKEMLARAIHALSKSSSGPFVAINCGAIPRDLVESELFGVRRGAFTGAYADAPGIFCAARGGTVFLDEIGEMPKEAQVKLLRVLQEGEVRPVGSTRPVKTETRIIAATNRPLSELRTTFLRDDLYFRIATVVIEVPPLRERREDILVLTQHIATTLSDRYGRHISVNSAGVELLLRQKFAGNVRELLSMLESVAAVSSNDPQVISDRELLPLLRTNGFVAEAPTTVPEAISLSEMEKVAIDRALRQCDGNRTRAAALLGISRDTLYRKSRDLGVRM
jgi:two-component system, NtrC family, response regulator AtoC